MPPAKAKSAAAGHVTPRLFRFLSELARNNDREWFNENKQRYLGDVRDPMLRLIAAFAPRLAKISTHMVADPRPVGGSLLRIYRDTRFARDKSPYKTNVGLTFRHTAGRRPPGPVRWESGRTRSSAHPRATTPTIRWSPTCAEVSPPPRASRSATHVRRTSWTASACSAGDRAR